MALNPKLILPTIAYFSCDISHRCSDIGFLEFTQDETSKANIESGKTAASGIQVDAHSCRRALHRMRLVCGRLRSQVFGYGRWNCGARLPGNLRERRALHFGWPG